MNMIMPNVHNNKLTIDVGPNPKSNEKIVQLPVAGLSVSTIPVNKQKLHWKDRFETVVQGRQLIVRRVDGGFGWGQKLCLQATNLNTHFHAHHGREHDSVPHPSQGAKKVRHVDGSKKQDLHKLSVRRDHMESQYSQYRAFQGHADNLLEFKGFLKTGTFIIQQSALRSFEAYETDNIRTVYIHVSMFSSRTHIFKSLIYSLS